METSDFIIALRNDISNELKKEIIAELKPYIERQLCYNVMNLKETARYLKLSEFTLRRMISRKEIPHFKQGAQYFFRQESINKWIDRLEMESSLQLN